MIISTGLLRQNLKWRDSREPANGADFSTAIPNKATLQQGYSLQNGKIMTPQKAAFFDTQVDSSWAQQDYSGEELDKIDRMLSLGGIGEGMRVFEPGCGAGRLTRILADRVGPGGRVLAVDFSSKMIQSSLPRIQSMGHAQALCIAVERCQLPREGFDAVVCHQVFPHFDDKLAILKRLVEGLAHSAVLIVSHFIGSAEINDVHHKAHPAVSNDFMPSETEMRRLFQAAGLRIDLLEDDDNGYLLIAHPY